MTKEELHKIKKGDVIKRMLAGVIATHLLVQEVTEDKIDARWVFDRNTGLEIDEDLSAPASYIKSYFTPKKELSGL